MNRTAPRFLVLAFALLAAAPLARAQDNAEFFAGKRIWVMHNGMLVPTGKIVAVNADGSYKVEVYAHSTNNDPRTTQPEEANLRGSPVATIDSPKDEVERWNKAKFTAWVMKDGKPWPKAEVIEDTGREVKVRIFDIEGTSVAEERTYSGADLEKFRELNKATAPGPETVATIDDATRAAVEKINAELAANGNKLSNGETFPRVHTLPEVVDAVKAIAVKFAPELRAEANPFKRAEIQDRMMREIYVTFERMTWIKHGGRDTTTPEWKAASSKYAAMLPAGANHLQRDIICRSNACYGKSKIVWEILNLAKVPEISGVGVRLLDGGFHGILYVEYDDKSRRTWETTEGFEPHGTRAFKRWEVMFSGRGSRGRGLDYMENITPMEGKTASRLNVSLLNRARSVDRGATSRGMIDVLRDRMKDRTTGRDKTRGY